MKVLIILLLISGNLIQLEVEKSPSIKCTESGDKWLETHAVYKDQVTGDQGLQGHYTKDNALVWGYYCK
jgi:hypothetical protein